MFLLRKALKKDSLFEGFLPLRKLNSSQRKQNRYEVFSMKLAVIELYVEV